MQLSHILCIKQQQQQWQQTTVINALPRRRRCATGKHSSRRAAAATNGSPCSTFAFVAAQIFPFWRLTLKLLCIHKLPLAKTKCLPCHPHRLLQRLHDFLLTRPANMCAGAGFYLPTRLWHCDMWPCAVAANWLLYFTVTLSAWYLASYFSLLS